MDAKCFRTKKVLTKKSQFTKSLSFLDLFGIGMGLIIGGGIFVSIGYPIANVAGPALVISFLIAGTCACFAAFAFAELSQRFPESGSSYMFCYYSIGEFPAFLIGWDLSLEYVIGVAAVSRGLWDYISYLFAILGIVMPKWLVQSDGVWFSFSILGGVTSALVFSFSLLGLKKGSGLNLSFSFVCVLTLLFFILCGAFFFERKNLSPFFPFGVVGAFAAVPSIFLAYVGFDAIVSVSEEAIESTSIVPAIFAAVGVSTLLYTGVSLVLSSMSSLQDLDSIAPLAGAFSRAGYSWISVIISLGGVFAMLSTLISGVIAQPRIIYSMSRDGLFPTFFSKLNRFNVPWVGTCFSAAVCSVMSFFFTVESLSALFSIGTLLAFSATSISWICLRYHGERKWLLIVLLSVAQIFPFCVSFFFRFLPVAVCVVGGSICFLSWLGIILSYTDEKAGASIQLLQYPFFPLVPSVSLSCNFFMLGFFEWLAWLRVLVWIALGTLFYFMYSKKHSHLCEDRGAELQLNDKDEDISLSPR